MIDKHDIPSWFIPDEEQFIGNEHERREVEENGELEEPLCPHCGSRYEDEQEGYYIHQFRPVDGEGWGEWEPDFDAFGREVGRSRSTTVTASVWCNPSGERKYDL